MDPAKKIPYGISDFKKLRENDFYYVDKSLLVEEIIENPSEVVLLPRPRRFGKTLNLSLLRYFFERSELSLEHLFEGLKIKSRKNCLRHQGQYPVIFITFKDVQEKSYDQCLEKISRVIADEYERHAYIKEIDQLEDHKLELINRFQTRNASPTELSDALFELSRFLTLYHGKKPIILIDEYDSPIHVGFENGYYGDIIQFFRGFLGAAMKDNPYLEKSVITGILRIARESVFSELNHIDTCGLLNIRFSNHFGLLESEVKQLLEDYNLSDQFETVSKWYNGYRFGEQVIYNPWSVISFVQNKSSLPIPYWVNTSSNSLIRQIIQKNAIHLKEDLEDLIEGKVLSYPVTEEIAFPDIEKSRDSIWSFLLFTGYLKAVNCRLIDTDRVCDLMVPNIEIKTVFRKTIQNWLDAEIGSDNLNLMLERLINGRIDEFIEDLRILVENSFSTYDTRKDFVEIAYHMFLLGVLTHLGNQFFIRSNRESGYGRFDLMLEPKKTSDPGFIFEFKLLTDRTDESVKSSAELALQQIIDKKYTAELKSRQIQRIYSIGLALKGKEIEYEFKVEDFTQSA